MKFYTYCLLFVFVCYQMSSCMNAMIATVSLAECMDLNKNSVERGTVYIAINPEKETEDTITKKILYACDTQIKLEYTILSIIKITLASRTKTPLQQLLQDGLSQYKTLVLRAFFQREIAPTKSILIDDPIAIINVIN